MSATSFSCGPASLEASFEIAVLFADALEVQRHSTLLLPARERLIALLTQGIQSGEIKMQGYPSFDSLGRTSVRASLTLSSFRERESSSMSPKTTAIFVDASLVGNLDEAVTPEILEASVTH